MRLHVLVIRSVKRGIEHTARSIVDVVVSAIHNEASETDGHCDSTESEDAKKTDWRLRSFRLNMIKKGRMKTAGRLVSRAALTSCDEV